MHEEEISVYIVNFNGRDCVSDTIQSLLNQEGVNVSIEVIDDGSTDGSVELISNRYPGIRIHAEQDNTKEVNRLRTIGINSACADRVFISDNDTTYDRHALLQLSKTMATNTQIAACRPRIMYKSAPDILFAGNGWIHFIGATIAETRDVKLENYDEEPRFGIGGGNVLLNTRIARLVGGFDEDYLLAWNDDGEFFQRLLLAGYQCMYVPMAIAFHEAVPFTASRHYRAMGQVHNRWMYILTHYSLRTILLLIPAFTIYEIAQFLFFVVKGIPNQYFRGNLLVLKNLRLISDKRKRIQKLKKVSDMKLVFAGKLHVSATAKKESKLTKFLIECLSGFLSGYWRLVSRLIS